MKTLLIAFALLTASCNSAPVNPAQPAPIEDGRSTEPSPAPGGYGQFCQEAPTSELC